MPKVSALMPVYNTNLTYLKETIESVLNQTYRDFEFLILNDSPENVELENFILEYAKKDERIKYFKNPQNLGISPSRNKLIDLAQGEFLAVIDHDDISVKERFEKEVAFLEANEEVGVVGGYYEDMANQKISTFPTQSADIKITLMFMCAINHPTAMIRKSVLEQGGGICYNALYSPCEDYKLWCDLINFTEFANLPEVMIKYKSFDNTTQARFQTMREKHLALLKLNSREHFNLFEIAKQKLKYIKRVRILGIPVMKIIKQYDKTQFLLFNHICVCSIKKREDFDGI